MNTRKDEKWRGQTGNKEGLKDGCKVRSVEEKKKGGEMQRQRRDGEK